MAIQFRRAHSMIGYQAYYYNCAECGLPLMSEAEWLTGVHDFNCLARPKAIEKPRPTNPRPQRKPMQRAQAAKPVSVTDQEMQARIDAIVARANQHG